MSTKKKKYKILQPEHIDTEEFLKQHKESSLLSMLNILKETNPYKVDSFRSRVYLEQVLVNVPLLYFASIYLYLYAQSRGIKHFLFTQRDCIHWYRIFQQLFPGTSVSYFGCSRNMFIKAGQENNQAYWQYIQNLIYPHSLSETMYVDIYGSGRSAYDYFSGQIQKQTEKQPEHPHIFLLSNRWRNAKSLPAFAKKLHERGLYHVACFGNKTGSIEILNYDLKGSIADYHEGKGFSRLPLEYDPKYVLIYHQVMERFLKMLDVFQVRLEQILDVYGEGAKHEVPWETYQSRIAYFIRFVQTRPTIFLKIPLLKHHPLLMNEFISVES